MATAKENLAVQRAVAGDTPPSALVNPSLRQEDQDMAEELKPVVIGPPAYASPDPTTNQGQLVPVDTHPNSADISADYGGAVADAVPGGATTQTEEGGGSASTDDGDLQAADWKALIDGASDEDALTALKERYDASGADYTTVESAFDDKSNELAD